MTHLDARLRAPWRPDVVGHLNTYQALGYFHPYTCDSEAHEDEQTPTLVATPDGWACPDETCTYTQDWAHAEHGDGRAAAEADILADILGHANMTPGVAATAEQVATVLGSYRFTYNDEYELHQSIAAVLVAAGFEVRQEVALSDGAGRIDMMTGRVGIEVKVDGSPAVVMRQITRYAACPDIDALVLVTSKPTHRAIGSGKAVNDKPVTVVWIGQVIR